MFSKHKKKQRNLGCFEGYSHLFLEDFIVVKPRPSGYLAIASNKATIQNNYTVQENPGFSSMNLHAWHVFKEVSIFSMCFHVFRFLSMCSKSHRLINASSWCVQSISICKGCGLLGLASSQMDFFCFGEKITGSNLEQTWGRKQSPSQNLETFPRKHSPSMGSPLQSLGFRLKHCRQ